MVVYVEPLGLGFRDLVFRCGVQDLGLRVGSSELSRVVHAFATAATITSKKEADAP